MADDPVIIDEVAQEINANLLAQLDVEGLVKQWLPADAQQLSGPISGAVTSFIEKEVDSFLASEQFRELWKQINVTAQQALIAALSGNSDGAVQIQGDEVVLDLGTLIDEVKARLVAGGLTMLADVKVPDAADRQIVLLQSDQLAKARVIYSFSVPIARWLLALVLLLYLAAILLAHRRSRMVAWVGVGILVNVIILRVALRFGETYLSASMPDPQAAAAGSAFFEHLTSYLLTAVKFGMALGLLMIIFGWLFGRSGSAVASRNAMARAIGGVGSRIPADSPLASAGNWVAGKRTLLVGVVIAVAALVLAMQDPLTAGVLILLTALVIVAVVLILVLSAAPVTGVEASDPAPEPEAVLIGADAGPVT